MPISIYPRLEKEIEIRKLKEREDNPHVKQIAELPFWCYNNTLHVEKPDNYQEEFCCLTHVVGLPKIREQTMPLADFQLEFCSRVMELAHKKDRNVALPIHLNKGRQMGFTEIVLRLIQYFSFNRYAGRNVGIMAATSGKLAQKDLRRLYRLYSNIPEVLRDKLKNDRIEMVNGTVTEAFPANPEAVTGDTNYAGFLLDEAAKWALLDDSAVFNSVMPIMNTNASDLFLVSTPKGPTKTFYKIHMNPGNFHKFVYPITRALGSLHTQQSLDATLASTAEDIRQEYFCEFVAGKDAVFKITDANKGEHSEWNLENWNENDHYVEPDDGLQSI